MNTAWISSAGDSKKHKLLLGDYQMKQLVNEYHKIIINNKIDKNLLTICISHYPISYLKPDEEDIVKLQLIDDEQLNVDLYLCGATNSRVLDHTSYNNRTLRTLVSGIGWNHNHIEYRDNISYAIHNFDNFYIDTIVRKTTFNGLFVPDYWYFMPYKDKEKDSENNLKDIKILYVDDDVFVSRAYGEVMEDEGYNLKTINSAKEALDIFEQNPHDFDLIILDLSMSNKGVFSTLETCGGWLTGVRLAERINEICPDKVIIALTNMNAPHVSEWFESQDNMFFCLKNDYLPLTFTKFLKELISSPDFKQIHLENNIMKKSESSISDYERKTLFLSYCSFDTVIADIVDEALLQQLGNKIKISRYTRDVKYKDSFKDFMNSISVHDFVLVLVSDHYLKSQACMYEVGEIIKDNEFKSNILFTIVSESEKQYYETQSENVGANIYSKSGQISYIKYWEAVHENLKDEIDSIKSQEAKLEILYDLKAIKKIIDYDIGVFIKYLSDANGKTFEELRKTGFIDIINYIFPD
jgi:CheY-like chemotaxis protein